MVGKPYNSKNPHFVFLISSTVSGILIKYFDKLAIIIQIYFVTLLTTIKTLGCVTLKLITQNILKCTSGIKTKFFIYL